MFRFVHEVRLGDRKFGLAQSNTKSESQNRAALEALSALMEEDLLQVTTFNRAQFSRQTNNRRH